MSDSLFRTLIIVAGVVLLVIAAGLVALPLGLAVAGLALLLIGILSEATAEQTE